MTCLALVYYFHRVGFGCFIVVIQALVTIGTIMFFMRITTIDRLVFDLYSRYLQDYMIIIPFKYCDTNYVITMNFGIYWDHW